jgi:hypothetical protein
MTNVPLPSFTDVGFTSPTEQENLAGVLADFNDAFGGALNPSLSTPQGQLATSLAAVLSAFNDLFVDYTNQIDPAFASGRMQDALARIYFLNRRGATPTTVLATISGVTGLNIPVGSLARAADGTIFQSLSAVTVPSAGTVDVQFAALTNGPIVVPSGALNTIYRTVPGWDSITNAAPGLLGRNEENRDDLEQRRGLSVAANATGILPAVRGAVLSIPEVVDVYVTENETAAPVTVGGQTLVAHSLYVCVQGGSDADVARAIWTKKPPGCNYTGTTSVTVEDLNGGYLTPPTYTVKFQRAALLTVGFDVTIAGSSAVPSDAQAQIAAAIGPVFAAAARIGQPVYASSFVCAIGALGAWARILVIEANGGSSQSVNINQYPVLGDVTVTIA